MDTKDTSLSTTQPASTDALQRTANSIGVQAWADYVSSKPDPAAVRQIADQIQLHDPLTIAIFGRAVGQHTSEYADTLLEQVRNKDLEGAGKQLGEVVSIARGLNVAAFADRRSKLPLIGPIIDRIKNGSLDVMSQFESSKTQIDRLIGDIETTRAGLAERNVSMEAMFKEVVSEYQLLGLHIEAGRLRLGEWSTQIEIEATRATTPTQLQALADARAQLASLEIRIGNLEALQHSALQTLPEIRMLQANNQRLVDKFHAIREVTVPAWKRQFVLAIGLNEQKNAAALATAVDDATQEIMLRNAKLVHQNSVQAAKANQRLAIDVETLVKVQDTLVKTVEDVLQIQAEGVRSREASAVKIAALRDDLGKRLAKPAIKVAA
jgi:uncharacterized protein YaaN involved in tellurite resistance